MTTRHQNYVFMFNKECLKEQGFDQEEQDKNAKFEDDILFYSTLEPTKLGEKLSNQIIHEPNCAFTIYIITDYLVENKQFPSSTDSQQKNMFPSVKSSTTMMMTGLYTFIDECLDEIEKNLSPHMVNEEFENNLDVEMSVFCIGVETPYNEGHIPPSLHGSYSNEMDNFKQTYNDTHKNNINLTKLKIKVYYVGYDTIKIKEATNELTALKNSIMLKKDKPDIVFKDHVFFKNNDLLHTSELSLAKNPSP